MIAIFILLVVYQIKHFLADYPLQGKFMLGKFKGGLGWILPLLAHVAVHGVFTFVIAFLFKKIAFECHSTLICEFPPTNQALAIFSAKLAAFDMVVHFIMDRIKASPTLLGRFEGLSKMEYYLLTTKRGIIAGEDASLVVGPVTEDYIQDKLKSNVKFWWALGLDQGVHHLTHYAIIWMLVS